MTTALIESGVLFTDSSIQRSAIASGTIVLWSGSIASIPTGWYLCNGQNGTPDLRNKFVLGAGNVYSELSVGGYADGQVVAHTHTPVTSSSSGAHTHSADHSHTGTSIPNGSHTHTASVTVSPGGEHTHSVSGTTSEQGAHGHPLTISPANPHTHPQPSTAAAGHTHPLPASQTGPTYSSLTYVNADVGIVGAWSGGGAELAPAVAEAHSHTGTTAPGGSHTHPTSALSGGSHDHAVPTYSVSSSWPHNHGTLTSPSFVFTDPSGSTVHNHTHPNANGATAMTIGPGGSHSHSFTSQNPPGSSPVTNANLPPFYALAFIMKG